MVWGVPGPAGLRLPSVGSRVPLPAASRNLSGSLTLLPLPTLFQGGVCGVETRTRLEEELYNREKPGRTSGDGHRQLERSRGRCKEYQGEWERNIRSGKDFCAHQRRGVHANKGRDDGPGRVTREESPELSRASPQRSPPPPTAVGPELVEPRERALVPVRFLLRRLPEPEPGEAAAEHRSQKPQLRPAHLGEWRASWGLV